MMEAVITFHICLKIIILVKTFVGFTRRKYLANILKIKYVPISHRHSKMHTLFQNRKLPRNFWLIQANQIYILQLLPDLSLAFKQLSQEVMV